MAGSGSSPSEVTGRASASFARPSTYKQAGLPAEELYSKSLELQPEIWKLLRQARPEGRITTCRDWSHLANRIVGANWFLCGEAAGFADPILSAGMTLAHQSGREAAYTILELRRGEHAPTWLRQRYDTKNRGTIRQHIQFAKFWYAANSCFTELKEHCAEIAHEAGLNLDPQAAWNWLGQGGFATESEILAVAGSFDPAGIKKLIELFDPERRKASWLIDGYNLFKLDLRGAKTERIGVLAEGRIFAPPCYVRDGRRLPVAGVYGDVIGILRQTSELATIIGLIDKIVLRDSPNDSFVTRQGIRVAYFEALEVMAQAGWIERKVDDKHPTLNMGDPADIRPSRETNEVVRRAGRSAIVRSRID